MRVFREIKATLYTECGRRLTARFTCPLTLLFPPRRVLLRPVPLTKRMTKRAAVAVLLHDVEFERVVRVHLIGASTSRSCGDVLAGGLTGRILDQVLQIV